jgi:hypothetical protein
LAAAILSGMDIKKLSAFRGQLSAYPSQASASGCNKRLRPGGGA